MGWFLHVSPSFFLRSVITIMTMWVCRLAAFLGTFLGPVIAGVMAEQ